MCAWSSSSDAHDKSVCICVSSGRDVTSKMLWYVALSDGGTCANPSRLSHEACSCDIRLNLG